MHSSLRLIEPRATLVRAYGLLRQRLVEWPEICAGQIYYQRNEFKGGDADDRVLGYVRYTGEGAVLVLHNLDVLQRRRVEYFFEYLPCKVSGVEVLFDTYAVFQISPPEAGEMQGEGTGAGFVFHVFPLQTRVLRLRC